ncbi:lipoprotein [Acidithiobacillus marinus]|nr:lipoprotein [Acidithiobacillus marinus]
MCLLVTGLAGCGRKTALSLPPPPAKHPVSTAAAPTSPPDSPLSAATGSAHS